MDRRDSASGRRWWSSIDKGHTKATVTVTDDEGNDVEVTVAIKFEVCPICDGKGSHVNPSIDAHGISAEEFAEDPDFAESYHRGHYDVACYLCGGQRVVPVCLDEKVVKQIAARQYELAQDRAEEMAERRMGA